ncbi:MAG: hypothetical protein ABID35_06615, partial [Candidatus Margulisiibacteriota bacterium]
PRGGKLDYRLRLNLVRNFAGDSSFKVGLDTLDAGFNNAAARSLTTEQLDIEGKFKLGGLDYCVTFGPGDVRHTESNGFFPSEHNTIYRLPGTSLSASAWINKMSLSGGYEALRLGSSGEVSVHQLTGQLKYKFGQAAVYFQPRYVFVLDGERDIMAEAGINYMLNKNLLFYLLFGAGDFQAGSSGMYVKIIKKILDPWRTGTKIVFRFDKVGSRYRRSNLNEYELIDLNNFNRLVLDGTADLGVRIEQKINKDLSAQFSSDYVTDGSFNYGAAYAGTYWLWQIGLNYEFSSRVGAGAFYRSYNVPSGLSQFSVPVPPLSEVVGLGLRYSF